MGRKIIILRTPIQYRVKVQMIEGDTGKILAYPGEIIEQEGVTENGYVYVKNEENDIWCVGKVGTEEFNKQIEKMKELWQMTAEEWYHSITEEIEPMKIYHPLEEVKDWHKMVIEQALQENKPVPPEVLKDYPNLSKGYKKKL